MLKIVYCVAYYLMLILIWVLIWIWIEYCFLKNTNLHSIMNPAKYNGYTFNPLYTNNETLVRIEKGRGIAKYSSLVICGLARDIKDKLQKNIPRLEYIGKHFKEYKIIIFENDSTDGTRELIKEWCKKNTNVILLQCCDEKNCECKLKLPSSYSKDTLDMGRIERMAKFRNKYLDVVKHKYFNYDWMLVADLDLEGTSSIDGLMHSLTFNEYDVIAINGRCGVPSTLGNGTMAYDSLSYLRTNETPMKRTHGNLIKRIFRMNYDIFNTPDNQLTDVNSAFNGMALYRISKILKSQYTTEGNCEHIGFHRTIPGKKGINKLWLGYPGYQGKRGISDFFFKYK